MVFKSYKNFEELEDCLTLPELLEIVGYHSEQNYDKMKFMAGLKGIDLEKGNKSTLDTIREKIAKKQELGESFSESEYEKQTFLQHGIGVEVL